MLGEFAESILSDEQQPPQLEQLNATAEAAASQMVTTTKAAGIGAADAGLTASVKVAATLGSRISTSADKIILSSPVLARIDGQMKNQTMLTLPLDEPDTLTLPQININSSNGPISPVPDTISFACDKISDSKPALSTIGDPKYFAEVSDFDFYGTWNSEQFDVDIELFPELN